MWEDVNLSNDWRPVCVHAIWTRLVALAKLPWSTPASPIVFISHECNQVVIQFLNKCFLITFEHVIVSKICFSNVGDKAYYLTGRLAILEQELIDYFSSQLADNGTTFILAPEMFKTAVVVCFVSIEFKWPLNILNILISAMV